MSSTRPKPTSVLVDVKSSAGA